MEKEERTESNVVLLRGHHLLCIQGFRGLGYSREFVEEMRAIVSRLRIAPETVVEATDRADEICLSCPHLVAGTCHKMGEESARIRADHDRRILGRLGLGVGERVRWSAVLESIVVSVEPDALPQLCRDCEWMAAGYCEEGLKALSLGRSPSSGD